MLDLKKFRTENTLTQKEFAELIGIPRTTYQNYELKKATPPNSQLLKIERAVKKIEAEKTNIEEIIKRLDGIKQYQKNNEYINNQEEVKPMKLNYIDKYPKKHKKIYLLIILIILILVWLW